MPQAKEKASRTPPYKLAGLVLLLIAALVLALILLQFRGDFTRMTQLTMVAKRSGLVMDPGSKVTYNGVEIGRVSGIEQVEHEGVPAAKLTLYVDPKYIGLIPANVHADIKATTVFGNKYVSFTSPKDPTPQRITSGHVIEVSSVTTEFDTLFETITQISERIDPVKLNLTLSATAEALTGLGDKFGASIVNGNAILDDVNPQMPVLRDDIARLADLGDTYAEASPDLWNALTNAVSTARTFNDQRAQVDAALMAAVGFGNTGAEVFERGSPYLVRGAADLVPSAQLLDEYSPELFCTIRNYHDAAPKVSDTLGHNGYSLTTRSEVLGAPNAYVYPDNLPRVNAKGGPGGRPGCWQPITKDLWPAPYLVMDTGASLAPYNHVELGSPFLTEYVWGRQIGEHTINP
jgi:phospholipid/cholesterol/gamma-HCH transport system substrate-binding protein